MAMTTSNTSFLQRAQVYSSELKEILRDEMMAQRYVRMLDGFPDGNTFNQSPQFLFSNISVCFRG